ncbi:MAG: class I SAM-dependent methyltransferase [Planctomycetota bacterium]
MPVMTATSTAHADAVLRRLPAHRPIVGAEVGVLCGKLSQRLLVARPNLATLYMIDRWSAAAADAAAWSRRNREPCHRLTDDDHADHYARACGVAERHPGRATIVPADSLTAAESIPDASLDFVFLDADHRREAVAADIRAWLPKVKPGPMSWIGGHDYDATPRRIAWGPEVKSAVDDAADTHGWSVETDVFFTWFAAIGGDA